MKKHKILKELHQFFVVNSEDCVRRSLPEIEMCLKKRSLPTLKLRQAKAGFVGELSNPFMKDLEAIVDIIEELGIIENDKLITSVCRL